MENANGKLDAVLKELSIAHDELYKVHTYTNGDVVHNTVSDYRADLLDTVEITFNALARQKVEIKVSEMILIMEYLEKVELIKKEKGKYRITFEGKVLSEDGGHTERARRTKIEYDLKEKQLSKMVWDVNKMKPVYKIAWVALILSFINSVPEGIWKSIYEWLRHIAQ